MFVTTRMIRAIGRSLEARARSRDRSLVRFTLEPPVVDDSSAELCLGPAKSVWNRERDR